MAAQELPGHVAIVMDGNGRWAERRKLTRTMGHQAGLKALRKTCEHGADIGINTLTVFAFSSENWNRPEPEVTRLMDLFMNALNKEVKVLHEHGVRMRFIGDKRPFQPKLRDRMEAAEALTAQNSRTSLNVAVNYGGRWDIVQASRKLAARAVRGEIAPAEIDEEMFSCALSMPDEGDPDLFIRTGGEMRISNFMLWQSAYTEFYFSPVLWPDFDADELNQAIASYRSRERRFGLTGEQARRKASA